MRVRRLSSSLRAPSSRLRSESSKSVTGFVEAFEGHSSTPPESLTDMTEERRRGRKEGRKEGRKDKKMGVKNEKE